MLQKMHMIFKLQNSKLRNRFFPSGNRQNIYCREFSTGQAKKLRKRPGAALADRPYPKMDTEGFEPSSGVVRLYAHGPRCRFTGLQLPRPASTSRPRAPVLGRVLLLVRLWTGGKRHIAPTRVSVLALRLAIITLLLLGLPVLSCDQFQVGVSHTRPLLEEGTHVKRLPF